MSPFFRKKERTTRATGGEAEDFAVRHLRRLGYRVVERNWRCRLGEIDLIAREGPILAFVEVKARRDPSFADPVLSVGPDKMRRILCAARLYLQARRIPSQVPCRFDVVGISLAGRRPAAILIRGAFDDTTCSAGGRIRRPGPGVRRRDGTW